MVRIRDAVQITRQREGSSFERLRNITRAELVDIEGSVDVIGRPGYVWAREYSQGGGVFQVFNPTTQATAGLPVLIGPDPNRPYRRIVLGWDWETIPESGSYDGFDPFLANHATTHEWPDFAPGADVVSVYPRSLAMLRTYAGNSIGGLPSVHVSPLRYELNGVITSFLGNTDLDISGGVPAAGLARYVLVYLDTTTNTIATIDGATTVDAIGVIPVAPTIPADSIASALVRLAGGQTDVTEADIVDVRNVLVRVTGQQASIADSVAWLENERDVIMSALLVMFNERITQRMAELESEIDELITRHIVGS